jgi:ribosomal protein S14
MSVAPEDRFAARLKLPSCRATRRPRVHNRCDLSGRSKAIYRKLRVSRIALRDLANFGQVAGHDQGELVEERTRWRSTILLAIFCAHPQRTVRGLAKDLDARFEVCARASWTC